MINAPYPGFDQKPEPFDCVRMNIPVHIHLLAVVDALMRVPACAQTVVGLEIVGKDHRAGQDVFLDQSSQRVGLHIGGDEGANLSFTLDHTHDWSFLSATSPRAFAPASVVRLVHFNLATESANRSAVFIGQHGPNLLEHAPCGFVGYASLALNLFRGDAAPGSRHEVHSVEPSCERSGRFVKYRVSGRVHGMAAMIARIRWATLDRKSTR